MRKARRLDTYDSTPTLAMGLDEALLELGGEVPVLRFYSWSPDTLSLGHFQKPSDIPGRALAGAIVRRATGGGAIHHVRELTFSLVAPLSDPLYKRPLAQSYELVHAAVAAGLARLGVAASPRGEARLLSEREGTGMCFHASTPLDLCWDGRKGLGSAQRRRQGRVLHHGSIKLGASSLDEGVATLPLEDPRELARVLLPALESAFELRFERDDPAEAELALAARLGATSCSREHVEARER
ncbi:MAG: hypothetical protein RL112_3023 [Planctomycetota bacterium]